MLCGESRFRSDVRGAERLESSLRCAGAGGKGTSMRLIESRRSGSVGGGGRARHNSKASKSVSVLRSSAAQGLVLVHTTRLRVRYRPTAERRVSAARRARRALSDSTPMSPSLGEFRGGELRVRCVSVQLHSGSCAGSGARLRLFDLRQALCHRSELLRRKSIAISVLRPRWPRRWTTRWAVGSAGRCARWRDRSCGARAEGSGLVGSPACGPLPATRRSSRSSACTWARTTTVESPSSSMLEDDSARFERARPRVFSAGVDSIAWGRLIPGAGRTSFCERWRTDERLLRRTARNRRSRRRRRLRRTRTAARRRRRRRRRRVIAKTTIAKTVQAAAIAQKNDAAASTTSWSTRFDGVLSKIDDSRSNWTRHQLLLVYS